jgi:ATP-binding cassette subfamily C protein CydD
MAAARPTARVTFRAWSRSTAALGRRQVTIAVGWGLADVLAAALQALLAGAILGQALAGRPLSDADVTGFAGLVLIRAAAMVLAERAAFEAGAAARRQLRADVFGRLLAIGPALLRARHSGELTGVATDKIDALEGYFARYRPAQIMALAGPLLVLAVVLARDPGAAGILALAGLFVPVGLALAGIGAKAATRGQFLAMERLQVRFLDRVRGIATLVALGRADAETQALRAAADELRRRTMRVLRVAFLSSAAMDLAAAAALVCVAIRVAADWHPGAAGADGAHLATLLLVPVFFAPLRAFAAAYQDRSHATAAAESLVELPEAPPARPPAEAPDAAPVRLIPANGVAVSFEDVTLRWDPDRPPALDRLSFRVAAAETLVLAGPSGSGKSSVLALLLGFVAPDSGHVRLNGIDIASIAPQALSGLVAWIGQRPTLFAATIEENIRFARPEASEAELAEAVRAARLDTVAAALPLGLATPIGEGGYGLSGGQAQRVAIARAFLRDAPLLLLDEPTSHLDPATESEVLDSLTRLAIGRTLILATHSAAARAFSGRRLDLRDGRAVTAAARGAA